MKIQFGEKKIEGQHQAKAYTGYSSGWPQGVYINDDLQSIIIVHRDGTSHYIDGRLLKDNMEWSIVKWYRVSESIEIDWVTIASPATWPDGKPEWGDKL